MTYKDPLHISTSRLVVMFKGKEVLLLNKHLLDQQNCWENLKDINETHFLKLCIYDLINEETKPKAIKSLAEDLIEIEFQLQELWKFPKDANYHRFWEYPKCICPKMDNMDSYPYQQYYTQKCLLHGVNNGKY